MVRSLHLLKCGNFSYRKSARGKVENCSICVEETIPDAKMLNYEEYIMHVVLISVPIFVCLFVEGLVSKDRIIVHRC